MIKLLLRILLVGAACIYGLALLASVSALKLGSDLCAQPAKDEIPEGDEARRVYQIALYNATHKVQPQAYGLYLQAANMPVYSVPAVVLYTKAAAQGYAPAMVALGEFYEYGKQATPERALLWYRTAAAQGYGPALGRLALYGLTHGGLEATELESSLHAGVAQHAAEALVAKGIYLLSQSTDTANRVSAGACLMQGLAAYYNEATLASIFAGKESVQAYQEKPVLTLEGEATLGLYEALAEKDAGDHALKGAWRIHQAMRPSDTPNRLYAEAPPASCSPQDTIAWLQEKAAAGSADAQHALETLSHDTK